ncbi:hypothetical protein ACIPL1_29205 [Pseudomonas sp. NPDC090202]|uniref:hypothetical protein n=1 Tax=unclassified Pseudomonas TaxID=196821 RepID=UPI00380B56D6
MPLQNRLNPHGQLCAVPARGTFMGNRGLLHNAHQHITRPWALQRWITCLLNFKGVQRKVMTPGLYTELFFLDEPTAYAAGHRPCSYCRHADFKRFKALWAEVFPGLDQSAAGIDRVLHDARLNADGSQWTWQAVLGDLPDGTMIEVEGDAVLLWRGGQWRWSFAGYEPIAASVAKQTTVTVLTPEPYVRLFAAGLASGLQVHPSLAQG